MKELNCTENLDTLINESDKKAIEDVENIKPSSRYYNLFDLSNKEDLSQISFWNKLKMKIANFLYIFN